MPRRGRSASPPPRMASRSSAPAPARSAAPARSHVPAAVPAQPSAMMSPPVGGQQPGLFKQMAATAGGVAVGSAVGHVVGHSLMGGIGGGSSSVEHSDPPAAAPSQPVQSGNRNENVCGFEMRQFLECAQNQSDLSLCEGFNLALRECRQSQGMY